MLVIRHDIRVKRELERLSRKAECRPCGFVTRGDHPLRSEFFSRIFLPDQQVARFRSSGDGSLVLFLRPFAKLVWKC